jgi:hypothetical protein
MRTGWQVAVAALIVGMAATAPICYASETVTLKSRIKPIPKTSTAEVHTAIHIGDTTKGVLPSPLVKVVTLLPPEMYLAASSLGLAICSPDTFIARGPQGCPHSAILGYGRAETVSMFGSTTVIEHAHLTLAMGPPLNDHTRLLDYAEGYSPASSETIATSTVAERTGPFGSELDTTVPLVTPISGAPPVSLITLEYSIDPPNLRYYRWSHGKRNYYRPRGMSIPARCPARGYRFTAMLTFLDNSTVTAVSRVPCTDARRP